MANNANGGIVPTDSESHVLDHRHKELIEDWPKVMEAEEERAGVNV